jgi:hypothetical protein
VAALPVLCRLSLSPVPCCAWHQHSLLTRALCACLLPATAGPRSAEAPARPGPARPRPARGLPCGPAAAPRIATKGVPTASTGAAWNLFLAGWWV